MVLFLLSLFCFVVVVGCSIDWLVPARGPSIAILCVIYVVALVVRTTSFRGGQSSIERPRGTRTELTDDWSVTGGEGQARRQKLLQDKGEFGGIQAAGRRAREWSNVTPTKIFVDYPAGGG
jgi:hypothetical protein